MAAHSLLGASSMHRWANCPGSFALSQTAPHRPPSRYAAAGTVAHEYIQKAVDQSLGPIPASEIGKTWQCEGHFGEVDQDMINGINVMLDYIYLAVSRCDYVAVEQRVCLDSYFDTAPPVSLFGTTDAVMATWASGLLEITDYKNGAGVAVSPVENEQLLYYAAGALMKVAYPKSLSRVRLTICQPHAGGAPIRSWDLSLVDLLMWVDDVLKPAVEACMDPNAPLVTGDWCRFCPVAQSCPKLAADAVAAAKQEFADDISDLPDGLDAGKLAQRLEMAERAELYITRLREFAVEQLKRQIRIPGWGLVPTRATRQWLQPDTDIANQLTTLGARHDDIWETRVRSPAQVEKQLHRTRHGRVIWSKASDLVEARSSGVKLGRDDRPDPREDFTDG